MIIGTSSAFDMEFREEGLAQALHRDLQQRLAAKGVQVWVHGSGLHWHCIARAGERNCIIHCFAVGDDDDPSAEYLAFLESGGVRLAEGRTTDPAQAASLAGDWTAGATLDVIHDRYAFVDRQRRALAEFEKQVVDFEPRLAAEVNLGVLPGVAGHCELDLFCGDRSSLVSFYGNEDSPRIYFQWDEVVLLTVQSGDVARDALMLRRWLCDRITPSAMCREFPELNPRPEAWHYEEGHGVEGEFLSTWDAMERFYRELHFSDGDEILALIRGIREAGYDRKLRAGHSLYRLIMSRSRRHSLRKEQPYLGFDFGDGKMTIYPDFDGQDKVPGAAILLTPQILNYLEKLCEKPID